MNDDFYEKGVDLKLLLILYGKRIWISILWLAIGAAAFGGIYFITHVAYGPAREYEGVSKLYLTFNREDDGDAYQYYNGYTWNDLLGTEPIMDRILEGLSEEGARRLSNEASDAPGDGAKALEAFTKEEVRNSITGDILSDIRLLTITVRSSDTIRCEAILRAAENALISFGEAVPEFEKIEVIDHGKAKLVVVENETLRATVAGAAIGFILSLIFIALRLVMEDRIYVPMDVERYLGLKVYGVIYRDKPDGDMERLKTNIDSLETKPVYVMCSVLGQALSAEIGGSRLIPVCSAETGMEIILAIPYGEANVRSVKRDISDLKIRGCTIRGAVITGAEGALYKKYFNG